MSDCPVPVKTDVGQVDLVLGTDHLTCRGRRTSRSCIRDRPFNLQGGGYGFLFRWEFFFGRHESYNIYFFCRAKRNFLSLQNSTLGYMTKTLNQIINFFLHQNQNIFFSNIGYQNIFLEKNHNPPPPPPQVKWSFPYGCPMGQVKKSDSQTCQYDRQIYFHWYKILGLLYKRALFDLRFVHNLFWLKLKWNARSKLFYCIIYRSSIWSSRTLTKLKSQSQKRFNERKYQYLKYKNKNHSGTDT